ncbi:unnamed protein product, partial [Staurois parvus]
MPVISISLLTSCHTDSSGDIYTDHQGTDDQCSPISATCQWRSMPAVSGDQCQLSVSINASCQCPSMPAVSTHQYTSMPHISAYQCTSMPHISAHLS